ncbi:MAG: glycosyltransferase family 4 protein [Sedimentisphaerales bacterium]|nr:glycosyltransferase family 4 protein [Sedimentisphaerales bacterium]
MIKVLYVISTLQRSGPVNMLFNLVKYLDREFFEPVILTLSKEPRDSALVDFSQIGIKVLSLNFSRIAGLFLAPSLLKKKVDSISPNIVHSQGIRADNLSAKYLTSYHRVSTLQNYPFYDYTAKFGKVKGKLIANIHLKIIGRLPNKIACAKNLSLLYETKHNLQIPYIQNGVDKAMFLIAGEQHKASLRGKYSLPKSKKIFITVGNLIHRKDTETTIRAFMKSSAKKGGILLVMGDGVESQKLHALAGGYENIKFLGNISNISQYKDYLQVSDFLISASLAEGLPTAVMEALSCGLPCILSNIEPHREILAFDQKAGKLTPVGDIKKLADAMDELAEMYYESMSKAAVGIVHKHLSSQKMAEKYQDMYEKLI